MASEQHEASGLNRTRDPLHGFVADPVEQVVLDHALQLELCNVLERIADSLPSFDDGELLCAVTAVLRVDFPRHFLLEESVIFPTLRSRGANSPALETILRQLEEEHQNDDWCAHELADELDDLGTCGKARNPDMLGYMLRGFFTSQRRHVEWENATIVPVARRCLFGDDASQLHAAHIRQTGTANGWPALVDLLGQSGPGQSIFQRNG